MNAFIFAEVSTGNSELTWTGTNQFEHTWKLFSCFFLIEDIYLQLTDLRPPLEQWKNSKILTQGRFRLKTSRYNVSHFLIWLAFWKLIHSVLSHAKIRLETEHCTFSQILLISLLKSKHQNPYLFGIFYIVIEMNKLDFPSYCVN